MKICIDARCLIEGRKTGVEEYTFAILEKIFELDKENDYVLFFNSFRKPRFDFSVFARYPNVRFKQMNIPNKLLNFCFWYLGWPKIDQLAGGADIVFMPNIAFASISSKAKLLLTVHDLSFERYGGYFSWKRRLWHTFINAKKLAKQADKIIAVSESTKDDLVSLYGTARDKIAVISSAVNAKFRVIDRNNERLIAIKEKYSLPYKFVLCLATIEPRKNVTSAVRAFNALMQKAHETKDEKILQYKLVIAGSPGWKSAGIFNEIKSVEFRSHIQIINFIEETDKEYLYNLASLFIYPSFFEGFGFPPLEAMRSGVPVIASNVSSLPEVVGDGGILIDPDKPDEIYRAMKEILMDKELREALIKKGLEQSKKFDWKKTAVQFLDLTRKML